MFDTICNATSQRQAAILEIAGEVDMVLVVGSQTSANSKRLAEISKEACGIAHLINSQRDINTAWFEGDVQNIGVTAGASTPAFLVEAVIDRLVEISGGETEKREGGRGRSRNRSMAEDTDTMKVVIDGKSAQKRRKGQSHAEEDNRPRDELRLEEARDHIF